MNVYSASNACLREFFCARKQINNLKSHCGLLQVRSNRFESMLPTNVKWRILYLRLVLDLSVQEGTYMHAQVNSHVVCCAYLLTYNTDTHT